MKMFLWIIFLLVIGEFCYLLDIHKKEKKEKKHKDFVRRMERFNRKGNILIIVMIFAFLMGTLAMSLLTMTGNELKISAMQSDSTKAFYQAESGIEKAIYLLDESPGYTGPLSEGNYQVEISTEQEITTLLSTGVIEGRAKTIEVKLKRAVLSGPESGLNYDLVVFSNDFLSINGSVSITGDIHSNGDLSVESSGVFSLEGTATAEIPGTGALVWKKMSWREK